MKAILKKGESFIDDRGILRYVNETVPGFYRRFYLITHSNTKVVRAWQGHLKEEKAFYAVSGSFIIAVVSPACFEAPGDDEISDYFQLTEENHHFLRVPGGNYTGIKALTSNSTLLVLSSMDLSGSKDDDYRQPAHRWVDWNSL